MRVLSWDIGVYNLSFCDIEVFNNNDNNKTKPKIKKQTKIKNTKNEENNNNTKNMDDTNNNVNNNVNNTDNTNDVNNVNNIKLPIKIHDWGIVPLVKKYCDNCGIVAIYRKGDSMLCNKHWKEIEDVDIKNKYVRIGKEKCCGKTKQDKPCSKKPNWLAEEEYFCSTHVENEETVIPLNNQTKNLNFLGKRIFEMCSHFTEVKYDAILFENQPCLKNPTMKSVQIILHTFFHLSYFNKNLTTDLQFISASNKLKVYDGEKLEVKSSNKYDQNKKLGILHTKYFLDKLDDKHNLQNWKQYLEEHSKKDDLCDSFLQALYYSNLKK